MRDAEKLAVSLRCRHFHRLCLLRPRCVSGQFPFLQGKSLGDRVPVDILAADLLVEELLRTDLEQVLALIFPEHIEHLPVPEVEVSNSVACRSLLEEGSVAVDKIDFGDARPVAHEIDAFFSRKQAREARGYRWQQVHYLPVTVDQVQAASCSRHA